MPRKPAKPQAPATALDFSALVDAIRLVHDHSTAVAKRAVNTSLTLRNWIIGRYLAEYELRGADRAEYGDRLFTALSDRLLDLNISNTGRRQLYQYLAFYRAYPQIVRSLPAPFVQLLPAMWEPAKSPDLVAKKSDESSAANPIVRSVTALLELPGEKLLSSLSYTHFEQLLAINDPLKRAFYEIECIRGNWSVRALKRQIASLYFERFGLSLDKEKLAAMAHDTKIL